MVLDLTVVRCLLQMQGRSAVAGRVGLMGKKEDLPVIFDQDTGTQKD